ncbi:MAG: hypothetical protein IOC72_03065, partial [Rhodobacter sp.]|nr:hypothetical protein [Rhodobacter sp.]
MVAAMAGFAVEDMFLKSAAVLLPVGQIVMIPGAGGGRACGAGSIPAAPTAFDLVEADLAKGLDEKGAKQAEVDKA